MSNSYRGAGTLISRYPVLLVALLLAMQVTTFSSINAVAEEKAAYYRTTYNEFKGPSGSALDDGDKISIAKTVSNERDPQYIMIEFRTAKPMWWKGIVLFNPTTKKHERVLELTDAAEGNFVSAQLNVSELQDKKLCLSKAKALGVKVDMYHIIDASEKMPGGHKYTITWHTD